MIVLGHSLSLRACLSTRPNATWPTVVSTFCVCLVRQLALIFQVSNWCVVVLVRCVCACLCRGYVNQLFLLGFRPNTTVFGFSVFTSNASVDFAYTHILPILPSLQPGTLNSLLTFSIPYTALLLPNFYLLLHSFSFHICLFSPSSIFYEEPKHDCVYYDD